MDFIWKNAKAVAVFIATVLLQAVKDVMTTGQVPDTIESWAKYLLNALILAAVAWLTGNKLGTGQVVSATKKLDTEGQTKVAQTALTALPDPVSDDVVQSYQSWGRHAKRDG